MAYKRRDRAFENVCSIATMRVHCAYRCVVALLPNADDRKRVKIARQILTLCDGKDRSMKITPAALQELVMANWQCIDRECPACFFWEPMSRAINEFFEGD